jgi:hypothetical protein
VVTLGQMVRVGQWSRRHIKALVLTLLLVYYVSIAICCLTATVYDYAYHREGRPILAKYSLTLLQSLIALCALLLSVHLVSTSCMTVSFFNSR